MLWCFPPAPEQSIINNTNRHNIYSTPSQTASDFLNKLINLEQVFCIEAQQTRLGSKALPNEFRVELGYEYFKGTKYPKNFDPLAFNIGTSFLQEMYHIITGLKDAEKALTIEDYKKNYKGPVEDFVNQIRQENGLPVRGPIQLWKDIVSLKENMKR